MDSFHMIDADIHVMEPRAVFDYLDLDFRGRVHVCDYVDDPDYREILYDVYIDSFAIPDWIAGSRESRYQRLQAPWKNKYPPGSGWDPGQYVKDLDILELERAVIYPTRWLWATWIPQIGEKFSAALARAYNDWLYDFCARDRHRLRPVICVSLLDVDEAIREVKRNHKRGFVGVFVRPNPLVGRTIGHPAYHRLLAVLEDLGLPLGIHEGGMTYMPILGRDRTQAQWAIHAMSHAFEQMAALISLLEHDVFDIFPRLHCLLLEAGSALWVPYWLDRLDEEMDMTYRVDKTRQLRPSEYWARQCWATFEAGDRYLRQAIDCAGDRHFMMTSDYPHLETSYPGTSEAMRSSAVAAESLANVVRHNALAAYPLLG